MRRNEKQVAVSIERLSSGLRINSIKDDAAGIAITTNMLAQVDGISVAQRNANDGISLLQTADGALGSIEDILQRVRELTIQSSNDTNSAKNRFALNAEAKALFLEIQRIASDTSFNGIKLLDGTFQDKQLQISTGKATSDRLVISINSAIVDADIETQEPEDVLETTFSTTYSTSFTGNSLGDSLLASGDLIINGIPISSNTSSSAKSFSASINQKSTVTLVNATASPTNAPSVSLVAPISEMAISEIDLGNYGKLVNPVQVDDGKWFYYWDRSGDGSSENFGSKNNALDTISFGQLIDLFSNDINGDPPDTPINVYDRSGQFITQEKYISDVYRYADLNGVKVALPTLAGEGGATMAPNGNNQVQPLTDLAINEVNHLYDDFLAIWDGFNVKDNDGRTNKNGTPPGWKAGEYWSATHYEWDMGYRREPQFLNLSNGYVTDASIYSTDKKLNVALQVSAPTMSATKFTQIEDGVIQINGVNIGLIGIASVPLQRANQLTTAINTKTTATGVSAAIDPITGGLKLTASDGRNIEISILNDAGITENSIGIALNGVHVGDRSVTTYKSTIKLSSTSAGGIDIQVTANGETATGLSTNYVAATETTVATQPSSGGGDRGSISSVDISTIDGALNGILSISSAIEFISKSRAAIGNYQNRLLSIYDNLANRHLNLSRSMSKIKDTDYAVETANLAKSQILQKASIAMLAQANQNKQSVLALLR